MLNKIKNKIIILLSLVTFLCIYNSYAAATQRNLQQVIQKSLPALVNIKAEHPQATVKDNDTKQELNIPLPDDLKPKAGAIGSGVIISKKNGIIVTNAHVVDKATAVIVTLNNGQRVLAKVIGKDKDYDIAVLAIDMRRVNPKSIGQLEFGNSDNLSVGQTVIAIGSPYGLSQTVTTGIVSALNRSSDSLVPYASFIQTDAPINPGNSGGALIDASGKLIGINTAIVSPTQSNTGIGFAIPSNLVKAVALQILQSGKVNHGVLGVMVQNLNPNLADAFSYAGTDGVIVTTVVPNTPAAKSGLRSGDIITMINDSKLHNVKTLQDMIRLFAPGTKIKLHIWRGGKSYIYNVKVADPNKVKLSTQGHLSGLRLQNITVQTPQGAYQQGVLVVGVDPNAAGNVADLAQGDIILRAAGQRVSNIMALRRVSAKHAKQNLLLKISRADGNLFIVIPYIS